MAIVAFVKPIVAVVKRHYRSFFLLYPLLNNNK